MIESLKPASPAALPCKICGGISVLYGVVDFSKCCEEASGVKLPLSGVPIYYRRCTNCEFVFTDALDGWSEEQFKGGVGWWYVAPRNGHISIFSRKALAIAFGRYGYKTVSLSDNLHFAFRTLPFFADHLGK
jgi:hypothetical protein